MENKEPHLKFFGAIDGEVTGSCHIYTSYVDGEEVRLGLDCGAYMGKGQNNLDNARSSILNLPDAIVVTHSHADHCSRLPVLVHEGYNGYVYGTKPTLEGIDIAINDGFRVAQKLSKYSYRQDLSKLKIDLRKKRNFITKYGDDIKSGRYLYDFDIESKINRLAKKNNQSFSIEDLKEPDELYNDYIFSLKQHNITKPSDIDNYEIPNRGIPYTKEDIDYLLTLRVPLELGKEKVLFSGKDNQISVILFEAGHILGSAQVYIKDKKFGNLWYSGDVGRVKDPLHLPKPFYSIPKSEIIKTLILESTYGDREHKNRDQEVFELWKTIESTTSNALFAAFSNNRFQDFTMLLESLQREHGTLDSFDQVICDGFTSKEFTKLFAKYGYIKSDRDDDTFVWANESHRHKVNNGKGKSIIVSSHGMMNGGAIDYYIDKILLDKDALLVLTGYQAADTTGHQIVQTGRYTRGGVTRKVKCKIFQCSSFSSHASKRDLLTIASGLSPEEIFLVHGDSQRQLELKNSLLSQGITNKVTIPKTKGRIYPLS